MKKFSIKMLIKSKNKRIFFYGGIIIMLMMLTFFLPNSMPKTPNAYLSFGFIWLSIIISVCFYYLIPKGSEAIKTKLSAGIGIYLIAAVLGNVLMIDRVSLFALLAVDFFLTFAIIIYGLLLYYFGNYNDEQY